MSHERGRRARLVEAYPATSTPRSVSWICIAAR
jgi:hypothetical protein